MDSVAALAGPLLAAYLSSEIVFLILYHTVLLKHCDRMTQPQEYRDYGRERRKLMIRIIQRMERTCNATGSPFLPAVAGFLRDWFVHENGDSSRSARSPKFQPRSKKRNVLHDEYTPSLDADCTLPLKGDVDSFFSWAFFGKDYTQLNFTENLELNEMYSIMDKSHGMRFEPGTTPGVKPMRLSIDPLQPSYRPLVVYFVFSGLNIIGNLFLRAAGFRRYTAQNGLTYWYRSQSPFMGSPSSMSQDLLLPLIFFHGIAPGGPALYLPMLLWGFGRDGRALYIFENHPISFRLCPRIFKEEQTVDAVWEAVNRHSGADAIVSMLAHSFGSCQATWLIHSHLADRIRQVTLIDPVSIMLSEPDVLSNFLYQREAYKNKIGIVANEIFMEHYLRRHFAWYNSELWLEDLPGESKVVICLSEKDEILNSSKIKREVEIYSDDIGGSMKQGLRASSRIEMIIWENQTHGYAITTPSAWKQTRSLMRKQEQLLLKESGFKNL